MDRTASGSRILIRVDAEVVDPARIDETAGIGVRVRSMQNGKVLFATSSMRQGVSLKGLAAFHARHRPAAQHGSRRLRDRNGRLRPTARPIDCQWSLGERHRPRGQELRRRDPDESGDGSALATDVESGANRPRVTARGRARQRSLRHRGRPSTMKSSSYRDARP